MLLNVKEMEVLCIFHSGTISTTLNLLREKESAAEPPERTSIISSLIEKLSGMKDGDAVSLAFEPGN